jgi:hypothetical protein
MTTRDTYLIGGDPTDRFLILQQLRPDPQQGVIVSAFPIDVPAQTPPYANAPAGFFGQRTALGLLVEPARDEAGLTVQAGPNALHTTTEGGAAAWWFGSQWTDDGHWITLVWPRDGDTTTSPGKIWDWRNCCAWPHRCRPHRETRPASCDRANRERRSDDQRRGVASIGRSQQRRAHDTALLRFFARRDQFGAVITEASGEWRRTERRDQLPVPLFGSRIGIVTAPALQARKASSARYTRGAAVGHVEFGTCTPNDRR